MGINQMSILKREAGYFDILNGPTYSLFVRYFWVRTEVFDEFVAHDKETIVVENDKSLKGKSRVEMGLKQFTGTKVRSTVTRVNITINQVNIAYLIGIENVGIVKHKLKDAMKFFPDIKANLFEIKTYYGKVKNMYLIPILLFKIIISSQISRECNSRQISWDHKHFLWFLVNDQPLNLSVYNIHHLYVSIKDYQKRDKKSVPYARLLYEIFYQ